MKLQIPSQSNVILKQSNQSTILGSLYRTYNIDLQKDIGKVKVTKSLLVKSGIYSSTFGGGIGFAPHGIATYQNQIWVLAGTKVWVGGNSPSDGLAVDATSGSPLLSTNNADIKNFVGKLIVTNGSEIKSYDGAWTSRYTYGTQSNSLLEVQDDHIYFSYDGYKIGNLDSSFTSSTSGANTINLLMPGYIISFIKSDGTYLWIGLINNLGGNSDITYVYKWNGSLADVPQGKYIINSRSVLSCDIVNGIPHVMDGNGRLLVFNGVRFEEVARLPIKDGLTLYNSYGANNQRGVHPNGMKYDAVNKELLIVVSNLNQMGTANYDFPGGVWSYTQESGLIHKYSGSLQPIADSGTTNLTDYGHYNTCFGGAIGIIALTPTSGEKGRILYGMTVLAPGETTADYGTACLFTNDTADTSQKYGFFITPEVHSATVADIWQKVYTMYKNLLASTDKIVVKFRTRKDTPTTAQVTWSDIDRITTSTDISSYSQGDEVQLIQGNGSGKSFHIKSIIEDNGDYLVILDDSMPSGVIGLTGIAEFSKWIKLGEVTQNDTQEYKEMVCQHSNVSPMVQIKCSMQFTGDDELYNLYLSSVPLIKE